MQSIVKCNILAVAAGLCVFGACARDDSERALAQKQIQDAQTESSGTHEAIDHVNDEFDDLLKEIVTDDGLVRYDTLAAQHVDALRNVVRGYAESAVPPDEKARLALWCNAYNANVLLKIIEELEDNPALESVLDIDGFFDEAEIAVTGEAMTLDHLENEKIRPLEDARIHAALVCAAVSCPPLRNEAYRAKTLDAQFDDQCTQWVNDRSKFWFRGDTLLVSKILDWYGEDFQLDPFDSRRDFVATYATDPELQAFLQRHPDADVDYLEYDWSLNEAE